MTRHISEGLSHRKGGKREHPKVETTPKPSPSFGDLTAEEKAVIRSMRQKKQAVEYTLDPLTDLKILDSSRTISNNIFSVTIQGTASPVPLEVFMTDPAGKTISTVKELTLNGSPQKVTLALQSNNKFDSKAHYFLIVREQGSGTMALLKEAYTINISFASDFDF